MLKNGKAENPDTLFNRLPADRKLAAVNSALSRVQGDMGDMDFKGMITGDGDRIIRQHEIEAINKFTLAFSCLIFFFIGAPLGAIIRKGGLGVPVIVSVLVFIVYYILDNTGYRMARGGMWAVWFGKGLAPAVLIPLAAFVTYKAINDSMVFNMDLYRNFFMKIMGVRIKRHLFRKEVILHELNQYPVMAVKAHTRPFERKWMNVTAAFVLPVGLFLYLRMWRFRLRLLRDLRLIRQTCANITERIKELGPVCTE